MQDNKEEHILPSYSVPGTEAASRIWRKEIKVWLSNMSEFADTSVPDVFNLNFCSFISDLEILT